MLGERAKWEDQSGQGEERNHKHQGRHGSFVSKYHSVLPGFLEPPLQVSSRKKHAYCELSLQMQTPSQSLVVLLKNQKVEWIVHLSNLHRHFRTSCQRLVLQAHPQEHLLPLVGIHCALRVGVPPQTSRLSQMGPRNHGSDGARDLPREEKEGGDAI